MADPRFPAEPDHAPATGTPLEPVQPGPQNRLRIAIALTLVASVIGLAGLARVGLFGDRSTKTASESPGPSAVVVVPSPSIASPTPAPVPAPIVPVAPTSAGLIAVVDDNGALSTVDNGGGSRVTYPAPGVVFGFPAWSPDGTRIAVVGTGLDDTAIYVYTVPSAGGPVIFGFPNPGQTVGPEPVVIYRSADRVPFYLYWTPDGRQIGFLADEPLGLSLRVAPADGSAPLDGSGSASVIRRGQPLYFDWLDAKRLLVHVDVGARAFLGEVGLDGRLVRPALKGTGMFRSASHSPDGRYLAYVRVEADGSEKLIVAARNGKSSHGMPVFSPAAFVFDPAGDTLATVAASAPPSTPDQPFPLGPLRLMNPATGKIRTVLEGPVVAFFWSPDGKTIAALLPSQPGDDQVTAGTGVVLAGAVAPRPSPDRSAQATGVTARLAFVDVRTGFVGAHRVVQLADHFVDQLLPYFDQYALSHRLWSPDSASILLPLVDPSGVNREVVVPVDGSPTRPVAGGAKGFWSPCVRTMASMSCQPNLPGVTP